jgi:hypothetical protein
MDSRIRVSIVHEAIQLSVPYDQYAIVQAFYTFYSTLPNEGEDKWGIELNNQDRYMTVKKVFECLYKFTQNIQDREAIRDRLIGNISVLSKLPFVDVEAIANNLETSPSS